MEDHSHHPANGHDVHVPRMEVDSSSITWPSEWAPGISSCIRLTQRTIVDLPQPEGPMIAVTWPGSNARLTPLTAWVSP